MNEKCPQSTDECTFVFCRNTGVCRKYFYSLSAEEKLSMRLRWPSLMENCTVGDILTSSELSNYRAKQIPHGSGVSLKTLYPAYETRESHLELSEDHHKKQNIIKIEPRFTKNLKRRLTIYNNYNGICWLCEQPVDILRFSIDHVIPVSKGGRNTLENLRPSHKDCNSIKASHEIKSSYEFYQFLKRPYKESKWSHKKRQLISEFEKAANAHKINNESPSR